MTKLKKVFPKTNHYVLRYPNGRYVSSTGLGLGKRLWADFPATWLFDLKIYYKRSDAIFDRDSVKAFNKCKVVKLHILV